MSEKTRLVWALLLLVVATHALAQAPRPSGGARRQTLLTARKGIKKMPDLGYARAGDVKLLLDVYLPDSAKPPPPLPVVVWLHGGAWRGGDKRNCRALPLVRRGYAVVSINYRLSQQAKFPAQIHDCKAAIRWVRANAARYGFDAKRIGVWGSSAGGHLAALLGTTAGVRKLEGDLGNPGQSSAVQAVCDFFGPTDFRRMDAGVAGRGRMKHDAADSPESQLIGGPIRENPEKVAAANPITYVTKDRKIPPFLIVHGDQDFVVPINQSELLHAALKKVGAKVGFKVIQGAGHGLRQGDQDKLIRMVGNFFDRHLKKKRPIGPDEIQWVNPPAEKLPGVTHRTFDSKAMKRKVGFNIYLPPGYGGGKQRLPVVYYLHGLAGHESRHVALANHVHAAVEAGKVPPMVMVFVNGGRGTMYSDSADGKAMSETAVIKELIPFIDANYRTIAQRRGRAIEGFSMGGFGALKLAFEYPELFCSVISYGGALHDVESFSTRRREMYEWVFGGRPEAFQANSPYELARKNVAAIRKGLQVRLVAGSADQTLGFNRKFRALLDELKIPYQWELLEGVRHRVFRYYELAGVKGLQFHARAFGHPK